MNNLLVQQCYFCHLDSEHKEILKYPMKQRNKLANKKQMKKLKVHSLLCKKTQNKSSELNLYKATLVLNVFVIPDLIN